MTFKVTIEVPLFLATFGFMLTASVGTNLLIYRTCYVLLGHNQSNCAKLGFVDNNMTRDLEKLVEPTSDYISLVSSNVHTIVGSIMCLFFAPWSDRFGRKPILILGMLGGTISMALNAGYAALESLSPWFGFGIGLPTVLLGGGASFMTILSAYLTDVTTKEERALRLGVFDVIMQLALLLGNTASSYLLIATSYAAVYCIAFGCNVLGLVFTFFFIPESLQQTESGNKLTQLFSIRNFIEMAKTPFKTREHSNRKILLLTMVVLLITFVTQGASNVGFYFVRQKLHWTIVQYTWFGTITMILGIVGTFFVVYLLHTLLHIRETILVFVGFVFSVVALILTGFAVDNWHIYLAAIIGLPSSGQNALTRSYVSKLVNPDEIAKIFSAFSIGSTILSPLASTGYTVLYNATIDKNPGMYNFVTAGLISVAALLFMIIIIVQQRTVLDEHAVLENEHIEPLNINASTSSVGQEETAKS